MTTPCNWVAENMVPQYPLGDYKVHESLPGRRR
jgi:hypothetical protein